MIGVYVGTKVAIDFSMVLHKALPFCGRHILCNDRKSAHTIAFSIVNDILLRLKLAGATVCILVREENRARSFSLLHQYADRGYHELSKDEQVEYNRISGNAVKRPMWLEDNRE